MCQCVRGLKVKMIILCGLMQCKLLLITLNYSVRVILYTKKTFNSFERFAFSCKQKGH